MKAAIRFSVLCMVLACVLAPLAAEEKQTAITPPAPTPAVRPAAAELPKAGGPAAQAIQPATIEIPKPAKPLAPAPGDQKSVAPEKAAKAPKKPPVPAKELFGVAKTPAPLTARAIGGYAKGCLAGAVPLAVDGPAWQAMRLSRNRNWGHPRLVKLVETLALEAKAEDGWNGLLVGDLAQPRGGPMLTGHASHQIGLDADVWLTPMPDRRLSNKEREEISATSMLAADSKSVDPAIWTAAHLRIIRRAATYGQVERIFVHPAIKKALCEGAGTERRAWLGKVRPMWGHNYHFHIRIKCPDGSGGCTPQKPPPGDEGCGKEVEDWIKLVTRPDPPGPKKPPRKKPPLMLEQLPAACRLVLRK